MTVIVFSIVSSGGDILINQIRVWKYNIFESECHLTSPFSIFQYILEILKGNQCIFTIYNIWGLSPCCDHIMIGSEKICDNARKNIGYNSSCEMIRMYSFILYKGFFMDTIDAL